MAGVPEKMRPVAPAAKSGQKGRQNPSPLELSAPASRLSAGSWKVTGVQQSPSQETLAQLIFPILSQVVSKLIVTDQKAWF